MFYLSFLQFFVLFTTIHAFERIDDKSVRLRIRKRAMFSFEKKVMTSFSQSNDSFYEAEVGFGSPMQKVKLLVDTGSSDTWVHSAQHFANDTYTAHYGLYNTSRSYTFHNLSVPFASQYADGSLDSGYYARDSLTIGDINKTILEFQFAVVTNSTDKIGILGLGPKDSENATYQYENLPLYLRTQNIIDSARFSLVLDDSSGATGSIIFGSTNDSAYYDHREGQLVSHQLGIINNKYSYYAVSFSGLYQGQKKITFTDTYSHFDTGYAEIQVPEQVYSYVGKLLNVTYVEGLNRYAFPCDSDVELTLGFEQQNITIPIVDLTTGKIVVNDTKQCLLGITKNLQDEFVFGDIFFKNIYTVFDVDRKTVSLAKALRARRSFTTSISANFTIPKGPNHSGFPTSLRSSSVPSNHPDEAHYGNAKQTTTLTPKPPASGVPNPPPQNAPPNAPPNTPPPNPPPNQSNQSPPPPNPAWPVYNGYLYKFLLHGSWDWWNANVHTFDKSTPVYDTHGQSYKPNGNYRVSNKNNKPYGYNGY